MLFWLKRLLEALGQILFDAFVPKVTTSAYHHALAMALKISSTPLFGRYIRLHGASGAALLEGERADDFLLKNVERVKKLERDSKFWTNKKSFLPDNFF